MSQEEEKKLDDPSDNEVGQGDSFVQRGTVLVDASYVPTLSALWQMTEIGRGFTGSGSGLLKAFFREFTKHLIQYVPAMTQGTHVPHSDMMIVFHGPLPSEDFGYTPKEYLRIVSDKVYYSVWTLSEPDSHSLVSLTRTAGADCWPKNLLMMVSDLCHPSYITNDGAEAIDNHLMQTFESLENERMRIPRALGSGLSSSSSSSSSGVRPPSDEVQGSGATQMFGSSTGSRPQSGHNTRATSPVGPRGVAMERELATERRKAMDAAAENARLRERIRAMDAAGSGGNSPVPAPIPAPPAAPLTQLPFDPALLASDPAFLAAVAGAFRNQGMGG